jgi:hypothetical protein
MSRRQSFAAGAWCLLSVATLWSQGDGPAGTPRGEPDAPVAAALAAISRPRPPADVFLYGAARRDRLEIVAEIPSSRLAAEAWNQGAEVRTVVLGPSGEAVGTLAGRIDSAARGLLMTMPLTAGAFGPWRVRVSIANGAEHLHNALTIASPGPARLLGAPIVYRSAHGPRSPVGAVADFQFRRTERVRVEWPVVNAFDRHEARLLNGSGRPLTVDATLAVRPGAGGDVLGMDLNLAPLGPGDYVIDLNVVSGTQAERRLLGIRVRG